MLYAFAMGWNPTETSFAALAPERGLLARKVHRLELLDHPGKLQWTHDERGLRVAMPSAPPCDFAVVFKIV
jgi:Alpha-L-fucosidase C-terminal domain